MKVAFDVGVLDTPHPTGVERAALELLKALRRVAPAELELVACSPRRVPPLLREQLPALATQVLGARDLRGLWRELAAPRFLREQGFDLWHAPVTAIPLRTPCARVATVHELAWLEGDPASRARAVWIERLRIRLAARRATRIVCPSRRTAGHLAAWCPGVAPRIDLVPHGVEAAFFEPAELPPARRHALAGGPEPYFLVLGRTRAKKNLAAALAGFARHARAAANGTRLVIAGPPGDAETEVQRALRTPGLAGRIHRTGWLLEAELPAFLAGASALLQLSDSEGFGLPVLEANAAGTPVVAAPHGALREAADGVFRWVDPGDSQAIARALADALAESVEKTNAVRRGIERARGFTWDAAARRLLETWGRALDAGAPR